MSTIDEIGRRAGQDAMADAAARASVDAGLARLLADADPEPRSSGRRWAAVAAVATVAAAAIALVVVVQDDPSEPVAPAEPSAATTVAPQPTTTFAPQTTTAAPTTAPVDDGLAVSYLSPPPVLTPEPFATIELGEPSTVAVAPDGAVVVVDHSTGEAIVVAPDGSQRRVAVDVTPGMLAAVGPGDVVYGLVYGEVMPVQASIVAIALDGDRAGQVVASAPVDPNRFIEAPLGALGTGPTGVVDRYREVGTELIGYVDADGQPMSWPGTPPPLVTGDGDAVRSSDGVTWPLRIDRHPDWQGDSYVGESPPRAAADGGATLWTSLGPPATSGDFPPPTMRVVAELAPDGTAKWHLLPDDWTVAASDVGGTVLARRDGDQLQLARLSAVATTAEPSPPATSASAESVDGLARAIGASSVVARRAGVVTSSVDGVVSAVEVPDGGYALSDGEFVWWTTYAANDDIRSVATTLDGTVVCDVAGALHRVRADGDGGHVASVEENSFTADGEPVPNFAVDCETGERQPIEPVRWWVEPGTRFVEHVGDRVFEGVRDAEGNADMSNESGLSISGDDYAGHHVFDEDGSRVVYGDYGASSNGNPLQTETIRVRDTTSGELLWSLHLGRPFLGLHWYGERIAATLVPAIGECCTTDTVVIIDATTGEIVTTVPSTLDVAFVE